MAQALTIPTITYGAAGQIALNQGTTTSTLTVSTTFARAGAFNSVNYGTLTIHPSALANLGVTEKVLVTTGRACANTAWTGGDILTVPSIFIPRRVPVRMRTSPATTPSTASWSTT